MRLRSFFPFLALPARSARPFAPAPAAPAPRLVAPGQVVEVLTPARFLRLYARAPQTITAARPVPVPFGAPAAAGFGQIAVTRRADPIPG